MNESLKLSIAQRQQTTLAPMQLQFVRMLEMNDAEAEDEVKRALDDNPALEIADDNQSDILSDVNSTDNDFNESAEQLQMADYRSEDDIPYYRLDISNRSASDPIYEPTAVAVGESLFEHLMRQLSEDPTVTDRQLEIANFIAGNLDSNGYMERTVSALVDDMALQSGFETTDSEVREVLEKVRNLEPAGVGAFDLRDSLLLQLRRRRQDPDVTLATEVIRDYFDLFSLMHFDRIASLTGTSRDQLKEAMDVIRSLNPKPGALISGDDNERTRHISPDFFIEADGDRLTLSMTGRLPQLQIEQSFLQTTETDRRKSPANDAANAFIRQKRDEAATFIKVLELRQSTLFRIVSAIMQWQREFFLTEDPLKLRPMVLKDIGAVTGDDLSVISRATTGKYIATSQGVYSIKSLFNERRSETDDASALMVIERIRSIINAEDKSHPLSDAAITDMLNAEGFDIARRTVAKYRERAGLPVGRLRKTI